MKKIYLIDWNNFIYRMFFALPEFQTRDWVIVNALFWMAKFFSSSLVVQNPDYIFFIKDAKGKNFRHDLYPDYKATRDRMPDNLRTQISLIEEMIEKMNIPLIEIEWYEADDVIWTLALKLGKNPDYEIDILSWDKDLHSLVTNNVYIMDTMKKKTYWPKDTEEKFWVKPEFITDYLAIVGDKSDNIPGIQGFGPKKAVALINNIWWVEKIYQIVQQIDDKELDPENLDKDVQKIFAWKTFEKLRDSKEDAFLSKNLATIRTNVKLDSNLKLENFKFEKEKILNENVFDFFKKYEFNSLLSNEWIETKQNFWKDKWLKVHIIDDDKNLSKLLETIKKEKEIVIDTETTSVNYMEAELVWISIYIDDNRIYYINRLHEWNRVSDSELKIFIKELLESDLLLIAHNLKYDLNILDLFLDREVKEPVIENKISSDSQTSFNF